MKRLAFATLGTIFLCGFGLSLTKIDAANLFPDGFDALKSSPLGWGQNGKITIGDYDGTFKRSLGSNSHGFSGATNERTGAKVSVQLVNTRTTQNVEGNCNALQKSVGGSFIRIETAKWSMNCDYTGAIKFSMQLAENPNFKLSSGNLREGTIDFGDVVYDVSSIHQREGGARSIAPIGYSFSLNGKVVGAVEKTGTNTIYISKQASETDKNLSMIAGTSLMLLWEKPE